MEKEKTRSISGEPIIVREYNGTIAEYILTEHLVDEKTVKLSFTKNGVTIMSLDGVHDFEIVTQILTYFCLTHLKNYNPQFVDALLKGRVAMNEIKIDPSIDKEAVH